LATGTQTPTALSDPATLLPTVPDPRTLFGTRQRVFAWIGTFVGVTAPLAGVVGAAFLLWGWGFGWVDLGLLVGMYLLTMLGITVGYHRLFTHRSLQTYRPIQVLLGILGSMAFQGPLISWVGMHRMHHQFSDAAGDPHSPHTPRKRWWARLRGFWHAHIGWAFAPMPANAARYAGDLARDPLIRTTSNLFPLWAFLGLFIPAAVGLAVGGWPGALTGFVWGGLVRVFLGHHVTWSVNSVCHLWGSRPYKSNDESRNNAVVGVLALGEGWHNNHHAFPSSARHGLRWWQIDISYYVIRLMVLCRLAWKVRLPSAEELAAQRRGAAAATVPGV
jgi:stearoyl-CoA desaturase (delta-9 desaturase)